MDFDDSFVGQGRKKKTLSLEVLALLRNFIYWYGNIEVLA